MNNSEKKKYAYSVIFVSASLLVTKLEISSTSNIKIPLTDISIPIWLLWPVLAFLYVPYIRELNETKVNPIKMFKKALDSKLSSWSRKYVEKRWPDFVAPLIKTTYIGRLTWSYKYHQANKNQEPSYEAISKPANTIWLSLLAFLGAFSQLKLLEVFTIPIGLTIGAIVVWLVKL